jgi:hypothetical protein
MTGHKRYKVMSNNSDPTTNPSRTVIYQIRIKGHLGHQWTDWFEGLTITLEEDGDTLLTGPVADQAALHGLLKKVRDLGLPLISVSPVQFNETHSYRSIKEKEMNTTKGSPHGTNKSITGLDPKLKLSFRKIAVITGVIFIIATVVVFVADALTPGLTGTDYLTRFSAHANQVAAGAFAYLVSAFASAGIAIAMYPVMKGSNAGLALGSVVFRALEAVFYMVEVVILLSLLTLGQQFTTAGAADRTLLQAIGNLLVSVREHAALVAVFAFCLGAFMYYYLFFQSRLIPRWLSGFGIAAIILMMVACVLALFSGNLITSYIPLAAPIALQEMVLAVWLIVKGFNPSTIASESAEVGMN